MPTRLGTESKHFARNNRNSRSDTKILNLVEMSVYASVVKALFDYDAALNVISTKTCRDMVLDTRETDRKMRIADGLEACVLEGVHGVRIAMGSIKCLNFFGCEQ